MVMTIKLFHYKRRCNDFDQLLDKKKITRPNLKIGEIMCINESHLKIIRV